MDSKGKKISLILITGIMTVLPLVGRTADSGNLLFLAMLVAISAVMLCVNILNQKNPVRVNIIDLIVLLFCSYVLVMGREAWYDTEDHIIDVTMHSAGVLTVYYADGETVHSVNNLTFDLNRVFCDKECNLIILETADGIVYEGYLQEEIK